MLNCCGTISAFAGHPFSSSQPLKVSLLSEISPLLASQVFHHWHALQARMSFQRQAMSFCNSSRHKGRPASVVRNP